MQNILGNIKEQIPNDSARQIEVACDRLTVTMGCRIFEHLPARVSTEVNARLSFDHLPSLIGS